MNDDGKFPGREYGGNGHAGPGDEIAAMRAEYERLHVGVDGRSSLPRVGKPPMVMRSIRVPEKLWEAAKSKADEREENISDVIREALERYVRRR